MDLTLSDFTAQLASAQPTPGGGGAAALTGALAASLTAMAANVTAANPRYAERSDALRALIDACETQRTTLLALIEADAAGFLPLQKAYAIPRTDPDRAAKLAAAAQTACLAPLAMLEHCAQTALLLTAALNVILVGLGAGVVSACTNIAMKVKLDETGEEYAFAFPYSFKQFFTAEDPALQQEILDFYDSGAWVAPIHDHHDC